MSLSNDCRFDVLVGKTLSSIVVTKEDDNTILFKTTDGETYLMSHHQDCCEGVYIESIVGDLEDLIGHPIDRAAERSNSDDPALDEWDESHTWTFYTIATNKGTVDIRWYGTSNGYYSEGVSFEKTAA